MRVSISNPIEVNLTLTYDEAQVLYSLVGHNIIGDAATVRKVTADIYAHLDKLRIFNDNTVYFKGTLEPQE